MLHYTTFGTGTPVLFLHGFLESSSMWTFLKENDLHFTAVTIDLPGHGASDLGNSSTPPALDYFAQKVTEVVDRLCLETYHVVGHSMGGYVALLLKENDARCEKVVLLNSNFWSDHQQKKTDRIRVADLAFKAREHLIREAIPGLFWNHSASDPAVRNLISEALHILPENIAFASLAMMVREEKSHLLTKFPADFMLIHGMHDPLIPLTLLNEKTAGMSVRVEWLTESGHMAHIEQPVELFEILDDFLS